MFFCNFTSCASHSLTMLKFCFLAVLSASVLLIWNPSSQASPILFDSECDVDVCLEGVEVVGMVPWGDGGGGGTSASGGSHAIYMDQLTGMQTEVAVPLADRPPACLREQMVLSELLSAFSGGAAPGIVAMGPDALKDPEYSSGYWVKMEYARIDRVTVPTPGGGTMVLERSRVVIHYMLNLSSKDVEQIKFKNTPAEACSN